MNRCGSASVSIILGSLFMALFVLGCGRSDLPGGSDYFNSGGKPSPGKRGAVVSQVHCQLSFSPNTIYVGGTTTVSIRVGATIRMFSLFQRGGGQIRLSPVPTQKFTFHLAPGSYRLYAWLHTDRGVSSCPAALTVVEPGQPVYPDPSPIEPPPPAQTDLRNVHRFWNGLHHFFTLSFQEGVRADYRYEGTAFIVSMKHGRQVLRCLSGTNHFLSTSFDCERSHREGLIGYVQENGSTPIYRLFDPRTGDHFYTTNEGERQYAVSFGYTLEGVIGFSY